MLWSPVGVVGDLPMGFAGGTDHVASATDAGYGAKGSGGDLFFPA